MTNKEHDTTFYIILPCICDITVTKSNSTGLPRVNIGLVTAANPKEIQLNGNETDAASYQIHFGNTDNIAFGGTDNWGYNELALTLGKNEGDNVFDSIYVNNLTEDKYAGEGNWCHCTKNSDGGLTYTAMSNNPTTEPRVAYFKHSTTDEVLSSGPFAGRKALKEWYVTVIQEAGDTNTETPTDNIGGGGNNSGNTGNDDDDNKDNPNAPVTPNPTPSVSNPVISINVNITNSTGSNLTLDGRLRFVLGNPDHNGVYYGGYMGDYLRTDNIWFSDAPITLNAGETKTFTGLSWKDEDTQMGLGETSPLNPSRLPIYDDNGGIAYARNVLIYINNRSDLTLCNNLSSSVVFENGKTYDIVIS